MGECLIAGKSLTDNFISRILYRIMWKLYKEIKSDIFVADFTRLPLFMRFVGCNKGHFLFSNCF